MLLISMHAMFYWLGWLLMQGSWDDFRALGISCTFCLLLQPLLELGSKSTYLSSGLWMLPKQCDTICWCIVCSQMFFCTFYLLLQPLSELGSKSTFLSSGFSDVIKAVRYDLLKHWLISRSVSIPGNVGQIGTIIRCGRCLAGGRGCLLKGPHLIPSLNFRLPHLKNVHQLIGLLFAGRQGHEILSFG